MLPDNGIDSSKVPASQQKALNASMKKCMKEYPTDPKFERKLNEKQLSFLYDWEVGTSIPCLQKLGFSGWDVPSRETFVATYGGQQSWGTYDVVTPQAQAAAKVTWEQVNTACPQNPPSDHLYAPSLTGG